MAKKLPGVFDPFGCPFKEFKDSELSIEYWGMSPAALQQFLLRSSLTSRPKSAAALLSYMKSSWDMETWIDDQVQPLPRSVRRFLHSWKRAEALAKERWEAAEVIISEEDSDGGRMSICDIQLGHAEVLLRSMFVRTVLSACYILESFDEFSVEHQWDNFTFSVGAEGWRARHHIYSPGMKPGGGLHHKNELSKNGCYLVRLFYLGAWRCVWVNDQVPIDVNGAPLLPFAPITSAITKSGHSPNKTNIVHLWPLLLCKALLKLAAPDMNSDEDDSDVDDEQMEQFNMLHCLTGGLDIKLPKSFLSNSELMWNRIISEVPVFAWEDDNETTASTLKTTSKSKSTSKVKKTSAKTHLDLGQAKSLRKSLMTAIIQDSKEHPPYSLPGLTPAYEMSLLLKMARDLPVEKPPPEPEVPLWKHIRWVDWARRHGLYDEFECPRTRFLKVSGLMKLSYAPHLLDVVSTGSITYSFRLLCHDKIIQAKKHVSKTTEIDTEICKQNEKLLREWVLYNQFHSLTKAATILYFPSAYQFASAGSSPPIHGSHKDNIKLLTNKNVDIVAPKYEPLYFQIDGPQEMKLRISLNVLHPRVLSNCGVPILDYIESAYLILEEFFWFDDSKEFAAKAFIKTNGYGFTEVTLPPGRHYFRVWVHSRMHWHAMFLSEASMVLGTRDVIMAASTRECGWVSKLLTGIGTSFINWIRRDSMSSPEVTSNDFFRSYEPDLEWDPKVVGYSKKFLHWMFRTALASALRKRLILTDFENVCRILSRYFRDPEFGIFDKPKYAASIKRILTDDLCDCKIDNMDKASGDLPHEDLPFNFRNQRERSLDNSAIIGEIPKHICDLASIELPCSLIRKQLETVSQNHEAAVCIQAHWRGTLARRCVKSNATFTADTLKLVMDSAFGSTEALSSLMNEFFKLYPGAVHAYSLASGLNGHRCLERYSGVTPISAKCKWVPFFQAAFYCHYPVKVHFNLQSNLAHRTFKVYSNDTKKEKQSVYNVHETYEFKPNVDGYTVLGFGVIDPNTHNLAEASWTLTVLCNNPNSFHPCDNNYVDMCNIMPVVSATKFYTEEMFIPNTRNIVSGINVFVSKTETISLKVTASNPNIELIAILRLIDKNGPGPELDRKIGKGELIWPFLRLKGPHYYFPSPKSTSIKKRPGSSMFRVLSKSASSVRRPLSVRSSVKIRDSTPYYTKINQYSIEVIAPNGWPLTLNQWKNVVEVLNSPMCHIERNVPLPSTHSIQHVKKSSKEKDSDSKQSHPKMEQNLRSVQSVISPKNKSLGREKSLSYRETVSKHVVGLINTKEPRSGDAFVAMECAYTRGAVSVDLDETRYTKMSSVTKSWSNKDKNRSAKCNSIRETFRKENLIYDSHDPEFINDSEIEFPALDNKDNVPAPTPSLRDVSNKVKVFQEFQKETESYLSLPPQLIEKFLPLDKDCVKEVSSNIVLLTADKEEAAKHEREARAAAELNRMMELQVFNKEQVLSRQRRRGKLLEKLFVGGSWSSNLSDALAVRDDVIVEELLATKNVEKKKIESAVGKKISQRLRNVK